MSFFNDECDLVDDEQYDLFTLSTVVERRQSKPSESPEANLTNKRRNPPSVGKGWLRRDG
jgi:hypothetical protein